MCCSGKQGRCQHWICAKRNIGRGKRYPFLEEDVGIYLQSCIKAVLEDDGKSVRMSTVFCRYNDKKKLYKVKKM